MDEQRVVERAFHVSKLTLFEIMPLYPFLYGREQLSVVDVGANIGLWCEAFHDVFGHRVSRYRAYEPMPGNVERLRKRLAEHLPTASVEVVEACAGDSTDDVTIHYDHEVTTLASVAVAQLDGPGGGAMVDNTLTREVAQVRLSDEITEHVDLVKIDTEGYEWEVIRGLRGAIDAGLVDNVYFEFGRHQAHLGQRLRRFHKFFDRRGWVLYRQMVGRNYFGLNRISTYHPGLEDDLADHMWMILATRQGPHPDYEAGVLAKTQPRVTGVVN